MTNRRDLDADALLRWHWGKAETIEHGRDVVKNELGGGTASERPLWRERGVVPLCSLLITYNVLSAMKQLALPPPMETACPERMGFSLVTLVTLATLATRSRRTRARR